MLPHTEDKKYFNNKINIVVENIASENGIQNEPNRPDELNDRNDKALNEDVVEKYLLSILKPMNMMQALFVCARYRIRDNYITPNSRLYSVLSVFASVILLAIIYILFFMTPNRTGLEVFDYFIINIYDFVLYFIGFFLDAITNIGQRVNNVSFVLKIQSVHRILNLTGSSFKYFIISNWACVIAINCFHFSWTCMYCYIFYEIGIANILASYTCIHFDMNVIYATRNMKLVSKTFKAWMAELQKSGFVNEAADDKYWDSMFESYIDIIQAFEILEKTFHRQILYYIVHTSTNALLDIWIRIEMKSPDCSDIQYAGLAFMSLTWVFKNLIILTSLSVECEKFYSAMTEVQCICIQIITSRRCSETRKRFCKNIQRHKSATYRMMDVCGLFSVDGVMPVQVLDLITTYTIVILQSSLLNSSSLSQY